MICAIEAHGQHYEINDPGGVIGQPLLEGKPYEEKVLEHIYRLHLEGTALDIGAHVGNHTLWFAVVCGMNVVASEPVEFDRLVDNVCLIKDLNVRGRIRAVAMAMGAREGRAEPAGKGRLDLDPSGRYLVAPVDSLGLRDVSLIKIDVEGMEPEVLEGASDTIEACRPRIFAEARDRQAARRVRPIMERFGYTHVHTYGATPLEEWVPC